MHPTVIEPKSKSAINNDVIEGLKKPQKTIPSKYFYDERGSELFEKICELDENYLTRTEIQIMENNLDEIAGILGDSIQLVELGSGSSRKTRMLLNRLPELHSYVPIDISESFLTAIVERLQNEFNELNIHPVFADYTKPFSVPYTLPGVRTVAFFPGSTIGNFTTKNAKKFISQISGLVGNKGGLLIGFDLLKDTRKLLAAYNDSKGVTAAFNKNILVHINRVLDADFDISRFRHRAIFNEEKSRIEMHLESLMEQQIVIDDELFHFKTGETIHTENSHKYTIESFSELAGEHFKPIQSWTDEDKNFCIQYLESR